MFFDPLILSPSGAAAVLHVAAAGLALSGDMRLEELTVLADNDPTLTLDNAASVIPWCGFSCSDGNTHRVHLDLAPGVGNAVWLAHELGHVYPDLGLIMSLPYLPGAFSDAWSEASAMYYENIARGAFGCKLRRWDYSAPVPSCH
jgi:hypothetical protein